MSGEAGTLGESAIHELADFVRGSMLYHFYARPKSHAQSSLYGLARAPVPVEQLAYFNDNANVQPEQPDRQEAVRLLARLCTMSYDCS